MTAHRLRNARLAWLVALAVVPVGCTTVPLAEPDAVLTEKQTVDLIAHSDRWLGRTVSVQVYPYDNGHAGAGEDSDKSYVACLERCDAAGADGSIVLIYTKSPRFRSYRGDRAEIVKARFRKICPDWMPLCLDAPFRAFALDEAEIESSG